MKFTILLIAALALFTAAPGASGQDKDLTEAIEILSKAIEEKSKALSVDLKKEVSTLMDLVDVEAMEKEVTDLITLDLNERKAVREALESFHAHWVRKDAKGDDEKAITLDTGEDSDWLEKIVKKAGAVLDDEDGAAFKIWLLARKEKVDKATARISAVAGELGGKVGELAGKISADAVTLGLQAAKQTSHLHELLKPRLKALEALSELHGAEWGLWAEDLTRGLVDIAEDEDIGSALAKARLGKRIRERISRSLDRDALKNLHRLSRIDEMDWDDFSERINEIVQKSLSGLDQFDLAEESFHGALKDYSENVIKATEQFRKALELQRGKCDHESSKHRKAVYDYLKKVYGDRDEDTGESDEVRDALKKALKKIPDVRKSVDAARKAVEKARLEELFRKEDTIHSRDAEIRALRKEIEELKRELEKMKKKKSSEQVHIDSGERWV